MRSVSLFLSLLVISMVSTAPTLEAKPVPFKGSWSGVTMSADPVNFPVVAIVSDGTGQLPPRPLFHDLAAHHQRLHRRDDW